MSHATSGKDVIIRRPPSDEEIEDAKKVIKRWASRQSDPEAENHMLDILGLGGSGPARLCTWCKIERPLNMFRNAAGDDAFRTCSSCRRNSRSRNL